MSKIISIDYGHKRVGLAVTDDEKIIATGLATVKSKDIFSFLEKYVNDNKIECFVVGEALNLNGNHSESNKFIIPFVKKLAIKFPKIKIVKYDERFTSKIAFQTMIDSGISKKARRNKGLVDKISATIILQSYLVSKLR